MREFKIERECEAQADNFHGLPFSDQINGYFRRWASQEDFPLYAARQFTRRVSGTSASERVLLSEGEMQEMLEGRFIPSAETLREICAALSLYGDPRQDFLESAEAARAGARERQEVKEMRAAVFRATNPGGNLELPSFAELLEKAYWAKKRQTRDETISTLLWNHVLPSWGGGRDYSPEQFCSLVEHNNRGKSGKTGLTNNSLYNWRNHPDKFKPNAESVEVLCKAFGLLPDAPQTPQDHARELMLWHVISGRPFKNPYPCESHFLAMRPGIAQHYTASLNEAMNAAQSGKDTGPLVRELILASGISQSRLHTLLGCHQMHQWCGGAHIENIETARKFIELVHPPLLQPDPAAAREQNNRLLALVTGRNFDIPSLIKEARTKGVANPGGYLFTLLTGRKGLVTLTPETLSQELAKQGIAASVSRIHHMRSSSCDKGGYIDETMARAILKIVAERAAIRIGGRDREECMDILTQCERPPALLALCVKGELAVGEMVRKTYERRGLTQQMFEAEAGIGHSSAFLLGKASLDHERAQRLAAWLGLENDERRVFTVLATGHAESVEPVRIIQRVKQGEITPVDALRLLFDASGLTRDELRNQSGVDIRYSVTERSGARLVAPAAALRKLASLCGLKGHEAEFIDTFASGWVGRTAVEIPDNAGAVVQQRAGRIV